MPVVSPLHPRHAVMQNPEVPARKRFCWKCHAPAGRATADGPGPAEGECAECGSAFNFRPALQPGEMVADQYEVQGCIAYGGLGWIYLAIDRNVSDRWVVLKGLRNPLDFEAHVVALAERQFLSEVTHPGIVTIHNFVEHRCGRARADGYIVMEYVAGRSLKPVLESASADRLPVSVAIAIVMEILPALDHLHSIGLAHNDLKPDNIMVGEDEVKLIDLGAVAVFESFGSIYGTPGYRAPEITETGPTVASDIYTVGRTLAALILELPKGADGYHLPGIPSPDRQPLLRRHPALYRLLQRATEPDPRRRFPTASSMYDQLAGVLRMVLAVDTDTEHPQSSHEFGSMRGDFGVETLLGQADGMADGRHHALTVDAQSVVAALPIPVIDSEDPSAELLSTLLHGDPRHALDALRRTAERIVSGTIDEPDTFELEATLTVVRAHLDLGEVLPVGDLLADVRADHDTDWRVEWYSGLAALVGGQYQRAFEAFDLVHGILPGEIAPALAVAAAAELAACHHEDDNDRWQQIADEYYGMVWRTNRGVASAAFGWARRLAAGGELRAAVKILDQVPTASRYHGVAQMTGCLLLASQPTAQTCEADLRAAAQRLHSVPDEPRVPQLQVVVLGAALQWVRAGGQAAGPGTLFLGFPFTTLGLQRGLESRLRALAKMAPDRVQRYRLVDAANRVRPKSWW